MEFSQQDLVIPVECVVLLGLVEDEFVKLALAFGAHLVGLEGKCFLHKTYRVLWTMWHPLTY